MTPTAEEIHEPEIPTAADRALVELLRQAPYLPSANDLAVASSPVSPWPHQLRVVREAVGRFPESFLFADEVGLGKTIEAGLVLRQLMLSGKVRRALVLVPKALLRQWQEELHEKMVLTALRFEGGRWLDVRDREVAPDGPDDPETQDDNPWNRVGLALASTQLARRRERRATLLAAEPWDLVIVDEAHHARRRGLGTESPRPNLLLELLAGDGERPGLAARTRCLYLLSATPMQVHPLEAFDLLRLLGLGGRWGSRGEDFLRYFEELRQPFEARDWDFLLPLADEAASLAVAASEHESTEPGSALDPVLGGVLDPRRDPSERRRALATLDPDDRPRLDAILRRRTPFEAFAFRHTRDRLRRYQRRGLLAARVPERRPENIWIELRPREAELYRAIEETLGELYRRYEARRRGLGFVMTLYRRRLTSSFAAMRRSLERRLQNLAPMGDGLLEEEGLEPGDPEAGDPVEGDLFARLDGREERRLLGEYLEALRRLPGESKLDRLRRDLAEWVAARGKVLVFTQYTDTLDFLRRQLVHEYAGAVGCFSGRGGERWDGTRWERCSKEEIKEAFRAGDGLRVLLCTEAAGEGLNLQTCGALINFDMPWNPMRVEQRIGRIDRIGQRFEEVWIRNYFYRDTVEAVIYQRLAHRIAWFEQVVGTLQPILHRVEESIEHIALAAGSRRQEVLEDEVRRLEHELDEQHAGADFDQLMGDETVDPLATREDEGIEGREAPLASPLVTPFDWRAVESTVLAVPTLARRLAVDPAGEGIYRLRLEGREHRVTFSPALYDRRPYSLRLLTWGEPLFAGLLALVESRPERDQPTGIGLYRAAEPQPVSLFLAPASATGGRGGPITSLPDLETFRATLEAGPGPWRPELEAEAASLFSRRRAEVLHHRARVEKQRHAAEREALVTAARRVLRGLAHLELANDRNPGLFDRPLGYGFGRRAITELARHGEPYPRLLELAGTALAARAEDGEAEELARLRPGALDRRRRLLEAEASELAARLERLEVSQTAAELALREPSAGGVLERWWFPLGIAKPQLDEPFERLDPADIRPFADAVPLYPELAQAALRFADPELLGHPHAEPQAEERRRPEDYEWVCSAPRQIGRLAPGPGLFVVPLRLRALDRRLGEGAHGLFRLAPRHPRPGAVLLVAHPSLSDPELGDGLTLRLASLEPGSAGAEGDWRPPRLLLDPDSSDPVFERVVLEGLEDEPPLFVAELVELL